jgi:hypothetical protein
MRMKTSLLCFMASAAFLFFAVLAAWGPQILRRDVFRLEHTAKADVRPYFEHAPGYSAKAFAKVRVGMTSDEVLALLGEPLMRLNRSTLWRYARSGGSFSLRDISFSRDGKVTAINKDFYWD